MRRRLRQPVTRPLHRAARHWIEIPFRRAAPCIKGANRALGRIRATIIADRRTDDDEAMADDRRRGDLKFPLPEQRPVRAPLNLTWLFRRSDVPRFGQVFLHLFRFWFSLFHLKKTI